MFLLQVLFWIGSKKKLEENWNNCSEHFIGSDVPRKTFCEGSETRFGQHNQPSQPTEARFSPKRLDLLSFFVPDGQTSQWIFRFQKFNFWNSLSRNFHSSERTMGIFSLSQLCFNAIISTEGFVMLNGDALKKLPAEVVQQLLRFMLQSIQMKLITQVIPLKIRLMRQNRLVTFKFKLHGTVKDTVSEIYEKFGGSISSKSNCNIYPKLDIGRIFVFVPF